MSNIIGALALCDLPGIPRAMKRQSVTRTSDTIYRVENVPAIDLFKTKTPKKIIEDESVFILIDTDGNHNHLLVKKVVSYSVDQVADQSMVTLQFIGEIQEHSTIRGAKIILPVITSIHQYRSILAICFTPPITVESIDTVRNEPTCIINQEDWMKVISSEYGAISYLGRSYKLLGKYDAIKTTISDITGNVAICGEWAYYSDKTPINMNDLEIVRKMNGNVK